MQISRLPGIAMNSHNGARHFSFRSALPNWTIICSAGGLLHVSLSIFLFFAAAAPPQQDMTPQLAFWSHPTGIAIYSHKRIAGEIDHHR